MIEIPLPIYEHQVFVTTSKKELDLWAMALGVQLAEVATGGTTFIDNEGDFPITIYLADRSPGTIAHECVHVANAIFKRIGQDLDHDNDEAYAYLVGYLVNAITHNIKTRSRKEFKEHWASSVTNFKLSEGTNADAHTEVSE